MHSKVTDRARGQWRGILMSLGIPEQVLQNKHGPCPICAGTDRFRFDNREGRGTWICNHCGAGDGIALIMKFKGLSFAQAAREVESVLSMGPAKDIPSREISAEETRRRMERVLAHSVPMRPGDGADRYLTARGVGEPMVYPEDLRFSPSCWYADDRSFPAMIAVVRDLSGAMVNLHRTFLADGKKAHVSDPRRLMQGSLPGGSAIRLGPVNRVLGVAEGVETALAASHRYELPVWSVLNAGNMMKWVPPAGVEEVTVFGDNDANYTGQAAAYHLANRLKLSGLSVQVCIPEVPGTDFADLALSSHQARLRNIKGE